MEYILALFHDSDAAARAARTLEILGLSDDDYHIRTHQMATKSIKGWFEWLFDMSEPLSGMEAEGIPHEDAHWYEDRVVAGETLLAARSRESAADEIVGGLRRHGGHSVRRYQKRAEGWTRFTGDDEAKTA